MQAWARGVSVGVHGWLVAGSRRVDGNTGNAHVLQKHLAVLKAPCLPLPPVCT